MTELEQAKHDLVVADVVNGKLVRKLSTIKDEIAKTEEGQDSEKTVSVIRDILFDHIADQIDEEDVIEAVDMIEESE